MKDLFLFAYVAVFLLYLSSCTNNSEGNQIKPREPVIDVNHPKYGMADSIFQLMKTKSDFWRCPGFACTIIADSSILVKQGYGLANMRTGTKIDENTVFRIASVSKSFAALTAKILEHENNFSFSDVVTSHIPELEFANQNMNDSLTIRHILSMSTGLPSHSYTNMVEDNESINDIIPYFKSVKPIFPLGKYCTYQNASFGLIEKVIRKTTGSSYQNQLRKKVLQPLNMKSTFDCDDFVNYKNIAWPHVRNSGPTDTSYTIDNFNQKYYNLVSAGGINASVSDLSKYLMFLLNGDPEILPDEKRKALFEEQVDVLRENRSYDSWPHAASIHYAYGWRIMKLKNGSKWVFHGGYVNRYQSLIVFNVEEKIGMCFLFNSDCPVGSEAMMWFIGAVEGLVDENDRMIE